MKPEPRFPRQHKERTNPTKVWTGALGLKKLQAAWAFATACRRSPCMLAFFLGGGRAAHKLLCNPLFLIGAFQGKEAKKAGRGVTTTSLW